MLLMSRCLHYPYGAEQRGADSSHFCEFVLSAKPDKGQCVYAGLTLSICIVGESPRLSILHLLDSCVCLLSKQTSIYLHHPVLFFFSRLWQDYWKQEMMRVVAVSLRKSEEVKAARPTLRSPPWGPILGPSRGQITDS